MGRSSADAEEFGRMFGSVRLGNMLLFGQSLAELRQTFGVICGFAFATFFARRWR